MDGIAIILAANVDNKPRAAFFSGEAIDAAVVAAHRQGFAVVVPATEELVVLAADIPAGRLTAAGRVSCSFVKQDVYDKFAALIGTEQELKPSEGGEQQGGSVSSMPSAGPDLWAGISAGSIVLATVGREDGWWEAVVLAEDSSGERLTLSWRDWPNMPSFTMARRTVAVIAPRP
ncbi:hypothetical protein [Mesorhizobium sp. M0676]|uniref:hypothetical protein n=1 Tax=Mesorhizobium sp. M0676 TaxID=2956984 RepID=UPI00333A3864